VSIPQSLIFNTVALLLDSAPTILISPVAMQSPYG